MVIDMPQIKQNFTDVNIYRGGNHPAYIVIHYFGAFGSAYGVSEYFKNPMAKASAHYAVDEKDIIYHCVKDTDMAWHCGAVGGLRYTHPYCRNYNSIGIEMRPKKINQSSLNAYDKDWYFDEKTVSNTIWLVEKLMLKYKIPVQNVIRHFDVCGKICPRPYQGSDINVYYNTTGDEQWNKFLQRIGDEMVEKINMIVDGKKIPVDRILKDNTNYIKIRDIAAALNLDIGFKGSVPILTSKRDLK